MSKESILNPYDSLLIRTEEAEEVQIKDYKTVTAHEDGDERIRVFVANPKPFRFYVGYEINVPDLQLYLFCPVQNYVKYGYATSERGAVLYALGRILANFSSRLPQTIVYNINKAIFQHRQLSLFEDENA